MHKRILTEKLKLPEDYRLPILGGWWYRFLVWLDNRSIAREQIPAHPLNEDERTERVICSLTSYPARIHYVHLAIKSLMIQSYKPDRIILWLAEEQFPTKELPNSLLSLQKYGLEICWMRDMYGHKKYYYPVLNQKRNEIVITFDDDIIFSPKTIERLVEKHKKYPHSLVCERAQVYEGKHLFNPGKWAARSSCGVESPVYGMNPSPGGGCLIPFRAFYSDALNESIVRDLAYKNDDLWYMFMCAENETTTIKSRKTIKPFSTISGSQSEQMATENVVNNRNEEVLKKLIDSYPLAWERIVQRRVCFVTAVSISANAFLRNHFAELRKKYDLTYISGEKNENNIQAPYDHYYSVDILRTISIWHDVKTIFQLFGIFRREKFHSVHSVTPKAGLLTACAAFMARVPVRIHIFTGQVWANKRGFQRWLLKTMDRFIAKLDTHILVDGEGQRNFLVLNGVVSKEKSQVLGKGSICGVDLTRFSPDLNARNAIRKRLGIANEQVVFSFLGRLNKDKGIFDLLAAFERLVVEREQSYLLLIGSDEEHISESFSDYPHLNNSNFMYYGPTTEPERILQAADVFVLPTYREGFGSSVIEASALELPVICSDVYGVQDAMVDDETGLRFHVTDVNALYLCMARLAEDAALRKKLGTAGRERVRRDFDGKKMTRLWVEFYKELLG